VILDGHEGEEEEEEEEGKEGEERKAPLPKMPPAREMWLLVDGHASGARNRLSKLLNKNGAEPLMFLPVGYSAAASTRKTATVRRIDAKSSFLLTLFISCLSVNGIQVLQSKNKGETVELTTVLLHEMQRQAIMNRDLD